eukprot:758831-Hanusia_phi.AAC.1
MADAEQNDPGGDAIVRHVEQLEYDEEDVEIDEQAWDFVRVCGLLIHFLCRRRDEACLNPDDNLMRFKGQRWQEASASQNAVSFEDARSILDRVKEF